MFFNNVKYNPVVYIVYTHKKTLRCLGYCEYHCYAISNNLGNDSSWNDYNIPVNFVIKFAKKNNFEFILE